MSSEPPIVLDHVSKTYRLHRGSGLSLRARLFERDRAGADTFAALRDITLAVPAGATMGLIGGNGAGKSTLLRVAAGLSPPSAGRVRVPRSTQSVLGLGSTFDGTLTGHENALTALIVNGLSRREAHSRLDAAVAFAELEDFMDNPVRTYSAGMTLRLAFGVAAQFRAEAFLVDEVLSVGDVRFQEKVVRHLNGLRAHGATIVMASHDLGQVEELCDEAVWLHAGRIRGTGPAEEVVAAYRDAMRSETMELTPAPADGLPAAGLELRRNRFGSQELRLTDVRVNGAADARISPGEALRVTAEIRVDRPERAIAGVTLRRAVDSLEVLNEHAELGALDDDRRIAFQVDRLDLAPGLYLVDVGLYRTDWSSAYDFHWGAYSVEVIGQPSAARLVEPPTRWTTRDAA